MTLPSLRLSKQSASCEDYPQERIFLTHQQNNYQQWHAIIIGPENTPYQNGIFQLDIQVPQGYPLHQPPKIAFLTKIYHPNILKDGKICLKLLQRKEFWSPYFHLQRIVQYISALLEVTIIDQEFCFQPDIAKVYIENRSEFNKTAKEWTQKYAILHLEQP